MDKIEFVKFGTRQRDNHTYAMDSTGVVWFNVQEDIWESIEDEPRRIKQPLKDMQLLQVMKLNEARR
jgi:hypothetical protein